MTNENKAKCILNKHLQIQEIEKQKQIFYLQHPELKKDYEQD